MFWSRKKKEVVESVEDPFEIGTLDEALAVYDASSASMMKKRENAIRSRAVRVPLKWSLGVFTIGVLLFSVLSVLFLWSGYKDVTSRLDTLPQVELSRDGFEFVGDGTYDNGKTGSGTFDFDVDFGVKEIKLPVYVGTDYDAAFTKAKFAVYANRYTVYVNLYGDVYELYKTNADAIGDRVYDTADLQTLKTGINEKGTFVIGTMMALLAVGKFVIGLFGGFAVGSIVYGLVALSGRGKNITYKESLRVGMLMTAVLMLVEVAILSMPMMYGPWLVVQVLLGVNVVGTALVMTYKAETGVVVKAIEFSREQFRKDYWNYVREVELSKMETLKEAEARKEEERKVEEAKRLEEERLASERAEIASDVSEGKGTGVTESNGNGVKEATNLADIVSIDSGEKGDDR